MINTRIGSIGRRTKGWILGLCASGMAFGFLGSCDDQLVALTNLVEPCGTILGNCVPGQFRALNADIPDWCVDPGCTVPGGCGVIFNRDFCKRR